MNGPTPAQVVHDLEKWSVLSARDMRQASSAIGKAKNGQHVLNYTHALQLIDRYRRILQDEFGYVLGNAEHGIKMVKVEGLDTQPED